MADIGNGCLQDNCKCMDIKKHAFRRTKFATIYLKSSPTSQSNTSHAGMQKKYGSGPLSLGCWTPALSPFFYRMYRMCAYCEHVLYIPGFLTLDRQYTLPDKQLSMHEY